MNVSGDRKILAQTLVSSYPFEGNITLDISGMEEMMTSLGSHANHNPEFVVLVTELKRIHRVVVFADRF